MCAEEDVVVRHKRRAANGRNAFRGVDLYDSTTRAPHEVSVQSFDHRSVLTVL